MQRRRHLGQQGGNAAAVAALTAGALLDAALVSATLQWSSQQLLKSYPVIPKGKEPQQVGRVPAGEGGA